MRGQRVLDAGEEQEVHGRQQQERPALGEWCSVEEGEHLVIFGHGPADDRVGGAAVPLDDRSEGPEMVGQRLFDEHGVRSWRGAAG